MSQAIAIVPGPLASVQILRHLNVTVTLTADTYATSSGGVTVDFTQALLDAGKSVGLNNGIQLSNVVSVGGYTPTGYRVIGTLTKTSNALDGKATLKLFNGTSEIGDGAVTQTLNLTLMVAGS